MAAAERTATRKRSIVKAITYRGVIICLDFLVIYILTGKPTVAAGFMIVSNVYTTIGYFLHERLWARIKWGIADVVPADEKSRHEAAGARGASG